jgi:hypothetical protein
MLDRITLGQRMFRVRDDVASGSVVASAVIRPGGRGHENFVSKLSCANTGDAARPVASLAPGRVASRAVRVFDAWASLKSLEDCVTRPKRLSRRVYALLTPFAQGVSGSFRPHRRMALPRSLFGLVEMVAAVD